MICKEADRVIPLFLSDDLNNQELNDFLNHIDTCPECKEELTIQFLVSEGMQRLEDGDTFNLMNELDGIIKSAKKRLRFRRYLTFASWMLQLFVAALAIFTVVLALSL
jgi:hypothetical protein